MRNTSLASHSHLAIKSSEGEDRIYFEKNNLTILKEISISHVLSDSSYITSEAVNFLLGPPNMMTLAVKILSKVISSLLLLKLYIKIMSKSVIKTSLIRNHL